jgi:hypothetical protein
MSKAQRIIFLRKPKGTSIMGITQGEYVVDGMSIGADKGGGRVASMALKDGMIYIRKVNDKGEPVRDFGGVSMPGTQGRLKTLLADGIAFPATPGMVMLFEDIEEDPVEKSTEDAPAKPAQQTHNGNQNQRR